MQKLIFRNGNGVEVDFTSGDFGIVNWTGLSEADLNIQTQQVPFNDGSVYLDSLIQDRVINITLAINDEKNLEKRYTLRREIIALMNPKLGMGELIYENDIFRRKISCLPKLPTFPTKNFNDAGTVKASLSFHCPSPYWEDAEETIINIESTKTAEIENLGDVDSNIEIKIMSADVKNPRINNLTTRKQIKLNGVFEKNLHINTNFGKKSVYEEEEKFNLFNQSGCTIISITYSSELEKFVAIGADGIILMSDDAINWELTSNSIISLSSITYSPELNLLVAVGYSSTIITSTDGINWTKQHVDGYYALNKIEYFPELNKFVCVGGAVIISEDGINWTKCDNPSSRNLIAICYSSELNLFVTMDSLDVYTSTDGINWTKCDNPPPGSDLRSMTYSSELNLFVIVSGDKAYKSSDLINWSESSSGILGSDSIVSITYSAELKSFAIACGYPSAVITSEDGINWTRHILNNSVNYNLKYITYSPELNLFVAGGVGGSVVSPDGINWEGTLLGDRIESITYSPELNKFVGMSQSNIYFSNNDNNFNWDYLSYKEFRFTKYFPELNLFVGIDHINKQSGTSTDGINWTISDWDPSVFSAREVLFMIYSSELNLFVALGGDTSYKRYGEIITSEDGINWTKRYKGGDDDYIKSIAYSPELNLFVAGGKNSNMYTSTDGINWTKYQLTIFSQYPLPSIESIVYYSELKLFVALGGEAIITSTDGINWTRVSNVSFQTMMLYHSELNLFIGLGKSEIYTSTNLKDWKTLIKINSLLTQILMQDDVLYIVGDVNLYSSANDVKNQIDKLSENSDMNLSLKIGMNKFTLSYDKGYAKAIVKYTNKYLGV